METVPHHESFILGHKEGGAKHILAQKTEAFCSSKPKGITSIKE